MTQQQTGLGERFIESMTPHARGNPLVATAILEVAAADDKDAAAREILDRLAQQLQPVIDAITGVANVLAASFGPNWVEALNGQPDAHTVDGANDAVVEHCWRCDAVEATTDVGLCDACLADLAGR